MATATSEKNPSSETLRSSFLWLKRYPKAQARDFDGNPQMVTEMDALVAYLQMLGTLVDFDSAKAQEQPR